MTRFSALLMICHGFFIQKYNECKSSPGCAEYYLVRSISRQTIRLYHNHFPTYTNERRLLHSYEKRYGQSIPKEWGSPNEKKRKNITNSDSPIEYTTRLFTRSIHRARIGDFLPYKSMVGSNLGYQFRLHISRGRVLIKGKLKSITFDNGREFADHKMMQYELQRRDVVSVDIYFVYPYHS